MYELDRAWDAGARFHAWGLGVILLLGFCLTRL